MAHLLIVADRARSDDFSRIAGPFLTELTHRDDFRSHASFTIGEMEALPEVLPRLRSALLIVKTDEGNLAKLLVSNGLRKPKPGSKAPDLVPVLVLDRFETLEAAKYLAYKARGKEIILFGEFAYDLDSGQVVPEGMGGDIVFKPAGPSGPRLVALGDARIYTFDRSVLPPAVPRGRPSSGRVVAPGDFAGSYHLFANGQWAGNLELDVKDGGEIAGRFRSDLNGSVYPVAGKIALDRPHHVGFTIQFPRAEQVYDGLLWTEGKNVLAGTFTMLERPYSFVAVREGESLASDEIELERAQSPPLPAGKRVVVVLEKDPARVTVDGVSRTLAEFPDALVRAKSAEKAAEVLVRVPGQMPFERINGVAETIRKTGIAAIHVALAADESGS